MTVTNIHTANTLTAASLLSAVTIPHVWFVLQGIATCVSIITGCLAIAMYIRNFIKKD